MNYNINYLKHVRIKANFGGIPSLDKELPKKITDIALGRFPIFEPRPHLFQDIKFSESGAKVVSGLESIDWIFFGLNKEKVLIISREQTRKEQMSLTVDYSEYKSFDKLKDDFVLLLNAMSEVFIISKIERLGLRYVNTIGLDEKNPLNWGKYINSNLISSLKFLKGQNLVSRAFHNLELKYDDMNIRFQYGLRNPDYPSIIKKKEFILDYDAYLEREQDISEIPTRLDKYHDCIESLFETSIKDGLRDKMNE